MIRRRICRQRGHASLTVLILGSVATFIAGAVIHQGTVAEREAVAQSLARTRAYWAAVGHISYALSRIRQNGSCVEAWVPAAACGPDESKAMTAQIYLNEIASLRTWTYPDVNSDYYINVSLSADDWGSASKSGYLKLTASFPTTGQSPLPVLNGLSNRLRSVELIYCVAPDEDDLCNNLPHQNMTGSNSSPYTRIYRMSRPPLS